jgi:hypothetical protein
MAATRPSSAIQAESPDSSQRWETKDLAEFTEAVPARHLARALEEGRDIGTGGAVTKRVHFEFAEMEHAAGTRVPVMLAENCRTRNSLIHFQQGLGDFVLATRFLPRKSHARDRLGSKLYQRLFGPLDPDAIKSRVDAGLLGLTQVSIMARARQATGGGQ